ncbi:hypothetical protein [Atopomonas sediminilitoris]|uniref:hypothetical protein n=1 Tax=Atopomonas sediminilitoris TaxID=2919919 RepID=UPI001F4DEE27|nr:hypothetical protein [Atopomonas sediminilitoris]MCJ8168413.1 hypothetical protein [Atopomonas sediminilitoris]
MRREQGFSLVAAMFLMIVVASVVIAMARLSANQSATGSLLIQQARAYQAARAGLEWGIYQALNGGGCTGTPTMTGSLSEYSVSVTCTPTGYTGDDGNPLTIYRLSAAAQNGSPDTRPDYAFRRLDAVVEQ